MSDGPAVDAPTGEPVPPAVVPSARPRADWLEPRLDLVVLLALAAGLAARLLAASGTWLNPDETLHYLIANQPSATLAYRASLSNAHPPLFILLLHFWRLLGTSELILRLISVLPGAATVWLFYKWLSLAVDRTTGAAAAIVLSFLPPLVALSAEVRQYAILIFFMTAGLYFMERSFQKKSPTLLLPFSLFLWAAILTHYSAVWFTCALGVYATSRILASRPGTKFTLFWLASQFVAAAIYVTLYFTQIRSLLNGAIAREAASGWLRSSFFDPGRESLASFSFRTTTAVFRYLFESPRIGSVVLVGFLCGLAVLVSPGLRPESRPRRDLALLLVLPFGFSCAGAVAGLFPYGDTRHTVFLSLFAVAGVSVLLSRAGGRRTWLTLLLAAALAGAVNIAPSAGGQFFDRDDQRRELMTRLLSFVHEQIPRDEPIFTDYQTALLLGYYLQGRDTTFVDAQPGEFVVHDYGGRRIIHPRLWDFSRESFAAALEKLRRENGTRQREWIWVIDAGWGPPLVDQHERFGGNICIFRAPIGPPGGAADSNNTSREQ